MIVKIKYYKLSYDILKLKIPFYDKYSTSLEDYYEPNIYSDKRNIFRISAIPSSSNNESGGYDCDLLYFVYYCIKHFYVRLKYDY